ncbi:hypothetical protein [Acidithiobacillus thiooxidans]|uniref:hypothetical protein n=1 Tax=Acidithiobacillus thiooxidans TaxID=930 RepID=UPI001C07E1AE|nr:hypothetical protein [Acidithiobacillus thiooxidans]
MSITRQQDLLELYDAVRVIGEWVEIATDLGRSIPEPRGRLLYAWSTPCPYLKPPARSRPVGQQKIAQVGSNGLFLGI